MKSAKGIAIDAKILERIEEFPLCKQMVEYIIADEEVQEIFYPKENDYIIVQCWSMGTYYSYNISSHKY